jgi:hypothetical protein
MRDGLTYTQMKLGWGYKRLDELKREIVKFRQDSYSVSTKDDIEESMYCIRIEQKITPDAIGMLVGEFAYALRSGLDHLAWQLALLTTPKPGRQTAFPIDSECPPLTNRSYQEKIADIPPAALSVIESLQPYKTWPAFKAHPLWQLNKLCTIDKHRVVAIGHIQFQITIPSEITHILRRDTNDTIEMGVPLTEKAKFQIDINCPGVVFGEPIETTDAVSDFEISIEGLESIYNFIRNDAVPRFESFFA